MIRYLTKREIIETNRWVISATGGHPSFVAMPIINPNSFDYLIEAVRQTLGDREMYPTLYEKAAAYAFHIIQDHVFLDGNKRTGMAVMCAFLEQNGFGARASFTDDEMVDLALDIAGGNLGIPEIAELLRAHFGAAP